MKVKRLVIKNIGKIADCKIELNKPLILFYGEIMQGKTTILNSVKWCFGGSFPDDIIRHGYDEASVSLEFDGGSISREWYRSKDGSTAARTISFVRDGKPVKGRVVDEIKKFLNPFLLDQDHLRKMTEIERKQYFIQLFGVDTADLDRQYSEAESGARELRAKIKGYGEIDLKEVKSIDVAPIRSKLEMVRAYNMASAQDINTGNQDVARHNAEVVHKDESFAAIGKVIYELGKRHTEEIKRLAEVAKWLEDNPPRLPLPPHEPADTWGLELQISEAGGVNARAEQYRKNLARAEVREADETRLSFLEAKQRALKKERTEKLSKIGEGSGIKGLSFDESGNFSYEGTTAGMLSGSQIMKLSEDLSNLYPKDLGISLIDRAESLGKSVFLLIDRAKAEEKTILATVVGELPAHVPEEVGVFVVDNGDVKSS
jgi:DNA repair exonuclease SbcCD ATPase subunit